MLESLESRQLLSASGTVQSDLVYLNSALTQAAGSSSSVQGYTPAQIAKAYGFNQISFDNGTVAGDGSGQTIAIIDAYNDPNIASDLTVFDQQFGLSAASLSVVNETGGSTLPKTDPGWAGEISLDVEWAHAMAPGAKILLVEASAPTTTDLMAAVDYARNAAGVSVVSMSWGGSEFVSYSGGESASQLTLDKTFTTPAGHTGVTFIASAGDSGFASGVQWPASSPNVISVGGTSLQTLDSSGTYASEGAWRGFQEGTSGGFSQYELEPSYQQGAQQSGARSTPDVGYDADPNTGFAVYDSVSYQGVSGWQEVGGTSAGAPQWAALVAIADQGRAIAGRATLDGATQTLAALYSVYSAPGTSGYSTYTSVFNDIGNDGYGYTTGLGSPKAANVVATLTAADPSSTSTTPTGVVQTPSPLAITFVTNAPYAVISGSSGSATVRLTNTSGSKFSGPVTITLYASAGTSASAGDKVLATVSLSKLTLAKLGSTRVKLNFSYSDSLPAGNYFLVASASATATNDAAAQVASKATISIGPPSVDLATTFASTKPLTLASGKSDTVLVTLTNEGSVTATGTYNLQLYASADQTLDISDTLLAALTKRRINLGAGRSITLRVHFVASASTLAESTYLIASTTSSTLPADQNSSNDTTTIATT